MYFSWSHMEKPERAAYGGACIGNLERQLERTHKNGWREEENGRGERDIALRHRVNRSKPVAVLEGGSTIILSALTIVGGSISLENASQHQHFQNVAYDISSVKNTRCILQ